MLPNEDKNRQEIQKRFSEEFRLSANLIDASVRFLDQLRQMDLQFSPDMKAFVLGTFVREVRRYRSIVALCAIGILENAEALTRSMYEGMLSLKYVLNVTIPADEQSAKLRKALERLAHPSDIETPEFRLHLYNAKAASTALRLAENLGEQDSEAAQRCRNVQAAISQPWLDAQRRTGSYSGLRIVQLAEYCGMLEYHQRVYPQHCYVTHANDAMSFVQRPGDGNAWVQLSTDTQQLGNVLGLASGIMFYIVGTLETALRCDANMDVIFKEHHQASRQSRD